MASPPPTWPPSSWAAVEGSVLSLLQSRERKNTFPAFSFLPSFYFGRERTLSRPFRSFPPSILGGNAHPDLRSHIKCGCPPISSGEEAHFCPIIVAALPYFQESSHAPDARSQPGMTKTDFSTSLEMTSKDRAGRLALAGGAEEARCCCGVGSCAETELCGGLCRGR